MSLEHAPSRARRATQSTRYLRKADLCERYGWKSGMSVDRAWKKYGTIPPPTRYLSRFPLWDEAILDAHDARARESSIVISPERKEAMKAILDHARAQRRKTRR